MKKVLGGVSMKRRVGFKTLMVAGLLSGVVWVAPGLPAQAADIPLKAPPATEAPALWWFHGSVELGYRGFLNDPQDGYQTSTGPNVGGIQYPGVAGRSLAKYYEYSDIKPGLFGNVWLSAGSNDGLYQVDFAGKNIGYNDQQYWLGASKAGQFYFNFMWDQSPHLYSTSAYTIYNVNGNALTLVPGAAGKLTAATLAPFAQPTDIGIKRDTASGDGKRDSGFPRRPRREGRAWVCNPSRRRPAALGAEGRRVAIYRSLTPRANRAVGATTNRETVPIEKAPHLLNGEPELGEALNRV